jgi:hypothetical protein
LEVEIVGRLEIDTAGGGSFREDLGRGEVVEWSGKKPK